MDTQTESVMEHLNQMSHLSVSSLNAIPSNSELSSWSESDIQKVGQNIEQDDQMIQNEGLTNFHTIKTNIFL